MPNTTTAMAIAAAVLAVGASALDEPIAFEDPLERRASRIAVDATHLVYSERVNDRSRIVSRTRAGDRWREPVAIFGAPAGTVAFGSALSPDGLRSPHQDASATLAESGESIVFASDRPGGLGGWDLYVAQRRGHEWLPPRNLGAPVNSAADETGPSWWSRGNRVFFLRATPESQAPPQVLSVPFDERAAQH